MVFELKIGIEQPFDTSKTGIPFYDMMLKNPEYFRKNKGLVGKVVYGNGVKG